MLPMRLGSLTRLDLQGTGSQVVVQLGKRGFGGIYSSSHYLTSETCSIWTMRVIEGNNDHSLIAEAVSMIAALLLYAGSYAALVLF